MDAQSESLDVIWRLQWRKSSRCGSDGCVEVAISNNRVFVRNSKDRGSTHLVFEAAEWRAFLAGAQNHEFDID
jgi:Domain of unknown function (DUF397)